MSRSLDDRFADIRAAVDRCLVYRDRLDSPEVGGMAYDGILRNLAVIGEAVKALPETEKQARPGVPWASMAGLRNIVVHEYFRVNVELVRDIADNDLPALRDAISTNDSEP